MASSTPVVRAFSFVVFFCFLVTLGSSLLHTGSPRLLLCVFLLFSCTAWFLSAASLQLPPLVDDLLLVDLLGRLDGVLHRPRLVLVLLLHLPQRIHVALLPEEVAVGLCLTLLSLELWVLAQEVLGKLCARRQLRLLGILEVLHGVHLQVSPVPLDLPLRLAQAHDVHLGLLGVLLVVVWELRVKVLVELLARDLLHERLAKHTRHLLLHPPLYLLLRIVDLRLRQRQAQHQQAYHGA
mmetsp:Transcript_10893/g.26673  ORF Transcript_10893/g.26673 Transcript_10893/m.26673 type:complete len:238 (+) Transcript_10893:33-746(+)